MPPIRYLPAVREWELLEDLTFGANGHSITVPAGFRGDLASIPRPLFWLIAPYELSIEAPMLHDWLYQTRGLQGVFTRRGADRLFLEVMERFGIPAWKRRTAWSAVRLFGWIPWGPDRSQLRSHLGRVLRHTLETIPAVLLAPSPWLIAPIAGLVATLTFSLSPYGQPLPRLDIE